MRCPDCSKFVSLETGDPEVQSVDIDEGGHIDAEVRLTRNCADCSTELKEATLTMEENVDEDIVKQHQGPDHTLEVEETNSEATESGGGRYKKNFIGVDLTVEVKCSCNDKTVLATVELHAEEAASAFEELV